MLFALLVGALIAAAVVLVALRGPDALAAIFVLLFVLILLLLAGVFGRH